MKTIIMLLSIIRDILIQLLPKVIIGYLAPKAEFAFLVHARDFTDIRKKFTILEHFPEHIIAFFCKKIPPIIFNKIVTVSDVSGRSHKGLIVGTVMTAKQMLDDPKKANSRIMQTLRFADKLDVKILGLGALFSSLTNNGLRLSKKTHISITNGNSLTTAVVMMNVREIAQKYNLEIRSLHFAVVGGNGSIGSCVASLLARNGVKCLTLIGRRISPLDDLKKQILKDNPDVVINVSADTRAVEKADFIIVATMSSEVVIRSEHIRKNTLILDITQPENVSKDIKGRWDIHYIKGGLVKIPGIKFDCDFSLPGEVVFACLAETILLSMKQRYDNYFLGKIKQEQVREINKLVGETDFIPYTIENK